VRAQQQQQHASKSWTRTLAWLAMAASVAGCSGGDGVPLGGPFGGSVTSAVLDASVADGSGVLDPSTASSTGGLSNGSQAPTWTQLYDAYLKDGTPGNCAHAGCHQSDMTSPSATFAWLMSQNQVGGTQPALLDPSSSCFTWLGGDMPPGGPSTDPSAQNDFDLWLKAGAKDN
jgi:hypothetical protein